MKALAKAVRLTPVAMLLVSWLAGWAGAQSPSATPAGPGMQAAPAAPAQPYQPQLEKTSELIGTRVVGRGDKYLGTIGNIVLTPDRRRIDYVVLSFGGFWYVPQKLFAVPWSQFQPVPGQKAFVLNHVTWKELQNTPGFQRDAWPTTAREDWVAAARAGRTGPTMPPAVVARRSLVGLTGMRILNEQNDVLGTISDFVVDTRTEQVLYAVLTLGPECPGVPPNLVAVPWPAIQITLGASFARLNADRQTLQALAFTPGNFPDLASVPYSRQLYERFGVASSWRALGYVAPQSGATPSQPSTDQDVR